MNEEKTIPLSDGRTAVIRQGKGKDVRTAQQMMGKDTSMYMNCLMHLLVEIDGQKIPAELYDEMNAGDYMELMSAVSDQNFTSPQKN